MMESVDIAGILNSQGSIVSCVLLQASKKSSDTSDSKVASTSSSAKSVTGKTLQSSDESTVISKPNAVSDDNINNTNAKPENPEDHSSSKTPEYHYAHLVTQISIDTTPKKRHVEQVLGGPFTFLGQYDEIGVVVMALRPDLSTNAQENPHELPPPLNPGPIQGDILLMRVSPTEEENEDEEEYDEKEENVKMGACTDSSKAPESDTQDSDEFFQDFTCEEYLEFVALCKKEDRKVVETVDIKETTSNQDDMDHYDLEEGDAVEDNGHEEDEIGEDEEEDDDEAYTEFDEDEERVGMMNLIMGQILRKFREEHGRGPDTKELLQMRQALAMKLGVEVPAVWDDDDDDDVCSVDNECSNNDDKSSEDKENEDKEDEASEDNRDMKTKKRAAEDALSNSEKGAGKTKKPRVRWSSEYQYKDIALEPMSDEDDEIKNEEGDERMKEIQQEA